MQFSLRSLMILTLVVCLLCAVAFNFPGWILYLVLQAIFVLAPAVIVMFILHGKNDQKTFAIGMAVSYGSLLLRAPFRSTYSFSTALELVFTFCMMMLSGYVAILVKRRITKMNSPPYEPPAPPRDVNSL